MTRPRRVLTMVEGQDRAIEVEHFSRMGMPEIRYAQSGDVSIAYKVVGRGPRDVVYHPGFFSHVEQMGRLPTY